MGLTKDTNGPTLNYEAQFVNVLTQVDLGEFVMRSSVGRWITDLLL